MIFRVALVDRHGEAEADPGHGGVDADHPAEAVGERAPGVAGIERRVGLDHVLDQPPGRAGAGGERAAERRDDAGRDGAGQAHRAADRDDQLPHAQLVRVAELGGCQVARVGPDHGEVGERIRADHLGAQLAAVGERGAQPVAAVDDVRGGEHVAVGGDRDAAAGALRPAAAGPARDGEVRDRGRELLGDPGDGSRVGVEGVGVGQALIARACTPLATPSRSSSALPR